MGTYLSNCPNAGRNKHMYKGPPLHWPHGLYSMWLFTTAQEVSFSCPLWKHIVINTYLPWFQLMIVPLHQYRISWQFHHTHHLLQFGPPSGCSHWNWIIQIQKRQWWPHQWRDCSPIDPTVEAREVVWRYIVARYAIMWKRHHVCYVLVIIQASHAKVITCFNDDRLWYIKYTFGR